MLRSVFAKTLWDQRRGLLGWLLGVAGVTAMYTAFYSAFNDPGMVAALTSYPKGILDALGVSDLTSPEGYLQGSVFAVVIPLLVVVFAVAWGARSIAGEEEAGTLDLLLANPLSRTRLVLERLAAVAAAVVALGAAVLLVLLAVGPAVGLDVAVGKLAATVTGLVLLGLVFAALAVATGCLTGRRAVVLGVTATVGVLGYFGNTIAPLVDSIDWLRRLSPFYYYLGADPLHTGLHLGHVGILLAAVAVLTAVAVWAFNRRDLAV